VTVTVLFRTDAYFYYVSVLRLAEKMYCKYFVFKDVLNPVDMPALFLWRYNPNRANTASFADSGSHSIRHTHTHTHRVGLLGTSYHSVAETST
jgi:hypothetical protein